MLDFLGFILSQINEEDVRLKQKMQADEGYKRSGEISYKQLDFY
ncbi:unnamed protein product [Paramecium sonneborni]|uniref:Uncharacterized protein n=1 Tax=Paramecium sonneborni TaxID=65129 RepID=A0A8S1M5Q8_9CILI|nr:unnamed protein product [Paramecium sonneborni]